MGNSNLRILNTVEEAYEVNPQDCFDWISTDQNPWEQLHPTLWVRVSSRMLIDIPVSFLLRLTNFHHQKMFLDIGLLSEDLREAALTYKNLGVQLLSVSPLNKVDQISEAKEVMSIWISQLNPKEYRLDNGTTLFLCS